MKKLTKRWLALSEGHSRAGAACLRARLYPQACRHAQLWADRVLRGLLHENSIDLPKSTNMQGLLQSLGRHPLDVKAIRRSVAMLNRYSRDFTYGYPGYDATAPEARLAARHADKVDQFVRSTLARSAAQHARHKK